MLKQSKKYSNIVLSQVFFLLNTVGLPAPINFTNLISLIWIKKAFEKKYLKIFIPILLCSAVYFAVHFANGVHEIYYLKTYLYLLFLVFSSFIVFLYLKTNHQYVENGFRFTALSSFILFAVSILLAFTPIGSYMWVNHNFAVGGEFFPRYKALSYEPSFYALTLSPIFIYFFLKALVFFKKKDLISLGLVTIPLVLTLSFGFAGAFLIAICLSVVIVAIRYKRLPKRILYFLAILTSLTAVGLSFDNFFSLRIDLMINGHDTSINGRTKDAFHLADAMAKDIDQWFGIGLGQIKLVGEKHIREFYGYKKELWPVVAIPNSSAETLAIFGYIGLILRFGIQIGLFFLFKVYRNYFNLTLFLFIFIYQLMGSYLTSTTEATIWVLSLVPIFNEFNITSSNRLKFELG